ncbi:MAG: glycerophosphodiester phosphodiesterase [Muribaculaceae bacterium]|nr:glycerophosphodiester phosphodiesterase [Muribaculaceae bacterium]
MNKTALIAAAAIMTVSAAAASTPTVKTIAHRGYWKTEGSAQNSIRALVKADSIGCYASEFDVWLSADSVPVVNHDATFGGVCMQKAPAAECTSVTLPNGEKLPTLAAYLDSAAAMPGLRLVLELKEHADRAHERLAVELCVAMIRERGLQQRTDYITFSRAAMLDFIALAPAGSRVYYLNGDMTPQELKDAGAAGLDYSLRTMQRHPEWFGQAKALGLEVNVWTVNDSADMQWCIEQGADYITTNEPELLQSIAGK